MERLSTPVFSPGEFHGLCSLWGHKESVMTERLSLSPISIQFSSLIPKMSTCTLAISCLTRSHLPWFMDLTFQVPMQYCSLWHLTLLPSPVISTTGCAFALALSLHSFWSCFSTLLQEHIGHLPTWGVELSVSYLFAFSCCSRGSRAIMLKWFASPFSSGRFVRTLHHDPSCLGWPYTAWLIVPLS